MGCISKVTLWIYITYIMGIGKCNEDKVFALTGCNATLEWKLGNTVFQTKLARVNVFNSSEIRIARLIAGRCTKENDSPVYCKTSNRGEEWVLSVVLISVTPENSGRYTGQIIHGLEENKEGRKITKELIVIDKPQIKKPHKIILEMPLNITCNIDEKLDGVNYRWKLNETDLKSTGRIYARSSTLMFESSWTVDKSSIFSCEVCQESSCCIPSEAFTLEPHYAYAAPSSPEYNDVASTTPSSWEQTDNAYTSPSSPEQNNEAYTSPSSPEHNNDLQLQHYWMEPVIVSVLLLVVGFVILVTYWRKNTNKVTDSRELCQPCVGQTDNEVSRKEIDSPSIPLPIPAMHENVCTRTNILEYPNVQTNPISLQNLTEQANSFRNQIRENVPLLALYIDDSANNKSAFEQDSWPRSMERSANESRVVQLFTKIKRDNVARDDYTTDAECRDLNNSRKEPFGPKLQEDLYSTIDEDALSVYSHATDKVTEKILHETGRSPEHVFYDYASSVEICRVETADVLKTDATYITPISDLTRPLQMLQDEETDMLGTDDTYITPIDDFADPR